MQEHELVDALFAEEPDFKSLAQLKSVNATLLKKMMQTADAALASRLLSLAGQRAAQKKCKASIKLIRDAASHQDVDVRIGAALGACLAPFNPSTQASRKPIEKLLNDSSAVVRHVTVSAMSDEMVAAFTRKLQQMANKDKDINVQEEAKERLSDDEPVPDDVAMESVEIAEGVEEFAGGALEIGTGDHADDTGSVIPIRAILPAMEV